MLDDNGKSFYSIKVCILPESYPCVEFFSLKEVLVGETEGVAKTLTTLKLVA